MGRYFRQVSAQPSFRIINIYNAIFLPGYPSFHTMYGPLSTTFVQCNTVLFCYCCKATRHSTLNKVNKHLHDANSN